MRLTMFPSAVTDFSHQSSGKQESYCQQIRETRTTELSLTTREGDEVSIVLGRADFQNLQTYNRKGQLQNGQSIQQQWQQMEQGQLKKAQVSVKGDLSANEQEEIERILQHLDDAMNHLMDNDMESVFQEINSIHELGSITEVSGMVHYEKTAIQVAETQADFSSENWQNEMHSLVEKAQTPWEKLQHVLHQHLNVNEEEQPNITHFFRQLTDRIFAYWE